MKISARNALTGKVVEFQEGVVTAVITIDIGNGNHVISSITMDSAKRLGIEVGKNVTAIIKASDVMLAVD
ncbi:MAG: TOBE domain-containing protein [Nisaea sp.]|uniref:TOBE domain-containing protein n=1 Tax=Nisaea sp. TaxID=2024842 RepID=UPI001B20C4AA|nr:TOBE domain-containing protein [Nisaea sp.]MBO6561577.1 TOBE domain-containing protein [Nisaea sp.]